MNDVFKRIVIVLIVSTIVIITISAAYFSNVFRSSREIGDVDHLSGQKIAVVTAYEGDYCLSDREDITLLRYDTEPGALMALCYKQVDGFATTLDAAEYVLSITTGFKINDKPIAYNGMASLFRRDSKILKEFNEFIEEYKKTDEYQDYVYKCNNDGYYDGSPITEETGTGEVIKVGYVPDYIPISYLDTVLNCPNGSEVEIIRKFANYMNYQIEWILEGEVSGITEIYYGNIDILLDGYSDVYRKELEDSPEVDMSDSYRDSLIVLLEVEDYDKLSIAEVKEAVE